ncbi:hypothetical protein H5410_012849 [Solanum commersonii]|uniref:Uncharacterized protein n=1 Tax=Solanum commersonii TaxID=4109 RepID=A0A9J6AU03_SOLCO|nr:hypothetical protein H5410_012849 [Solanum commersonii]
MDHSIVGITLYPVAAGKHLAGELDRHGKTALVEEENLGVTFQKA